MADWERLARAVVVRRVQMGLNTREHLVVAAGMSRRLLGDIETARRESYDPATLARLEHALGWLPGSADAVLTGGDPKLIPGTAGAVTEESDGTLDRIVAGIRQSDLPAETVERLVDLARELHRRNEAAAAEMRRRQEADLQAQVQVMLDVARGTLPGDG